jgi:hypothetical protein
MPVLPLGEAGECPVTTESEVENLTKGVIAPQIGSFPLSTSKNLPIARAGTEIGRFCTRVAHALVSPHAADIAPVGR